MTREELDAIRARVEAATKGPWEIHRYQEGHDLVQADTYVCSSTGVEPWWPEFRYNHGHTGVVWVLQSRMYRPADGYAPWSQRDREFVAHARTDIPKLLDEVERLRVKAGETVELLEGLA